VIIFKLQRYGWEKLYRGRPDSGK
jgi:hypothetical protein